jgi:phytoene dehydrogenase-like protein
MEVTVVEQAPGPGGAVSSFEDEIGGFVHDRCAGFFPATRVSPTFRELDLERDGLEWIAPPIAMAHPFSDGTAICLEQSVAATAASLDAAVPGAGERWERLMDDLLPRRKLLIQAGMHRFPPLLPALRLAAGLRREGLELARQLLSSASSVGHDVLGGERAAAWLAGSAMHSDLGPGASASAGVAVLLHLLGHWVGWPFPRGGAGRLTAALVARLESHGGRLRCGARVERVLLARGRASGVALAGGEELPAEVTVVTVSARPFAAMLAPGALPPRLARRLRSWRYGLGTLKVDFALSGPLPWTAAQARSAGVVQLGGELHELFDAAHAAAQGRVPTALPLIVGQQSLFDSTRSPPGCHTLYSYARITSRPVLAEDELAELVEQRIESFAPGFRDLILSRTVRTPQRLELENPSLVGGDLAGGSLELDQQLLFRPAIELVRYRTPVRGLYLAGASVHPGPAVHGVSGAGAARAALADVSPLPGWHR